MSSTTTADSEIAEGSVTIATTESVHAKESVITQTYDPAESPEIVAELLPVDQE